MEWSWPFDAALVWRGVSVVVLGWLAFFFGRTLLPGRVALIERIALVSEPALPAPLRRYTRQLTAVWSLYFVIAALLSLASGASGALTGVVVWTGTLILFVGEHWVRPRLFPGHTFPGLAQQLRDTWSIWRPR
ncbi:MAG TPA: hypothetical protein VK996_06725 [Ramlibacter sp.]|nr:hypothetical protein [Ramlibacter sp.]